MPTRLARGARGAWRKCRTFRWLLLSRQRFMMRQACGWIRCRWFQIASSRRCGSMALAFFNRCLVLVRGGGDLASGAIYRLHRAGFPVIVTELPAPLLVRRTVSYGEAVYGGTITIEGITARR